MTQRKYRGKSIPVRVYTTRGLKDQARLALECAHQTVDYFSEIFEVEYPLPKADLLAVHEFVRAYAVFPRLNVELTRVSFQAMGAMENWGLVTYRTTAVLFDEGKSDNRYKNRIAYVVAHGEDCMAFDPNRNEQNLIHISLQSWLISGLVISSQWTGGMSSG